MTLAPPNEAIKSENCVEKNLNKVKKNYPNDLGGHARCKNSITIKKAQDFVRVGERGIELMVLTYLLLIYRISSVNGKSFHSGSTLNPDSSIRVFVLVHGSLQKLDSTLWRIPSFITSILCPTL